MVKISTHVEHIPYDVIAAYLVAEKLINRQESPKIKLRIVDKQMNKVPSILTPTKQLRLILKFSNFKLDLLFITTN